MKSNTNLVLEKLYLVDKPPPAPEPYLKALQGLAPFLSQHSVPWQFVCPDKAYRETERVLREHEQTMASLDLRYYNEVYLPTERAFEFLRPAKIDVERWQAVVETDQHGVARSFKPDSDGYACVPEYTRLETITGRLKVVNGPNILGLPRIYRDVLQSRWPGGKVVSLDYRALEPWTVLNLAPPGLVITSDTGETQGSGTLPVGGGWGLVSNTSLGLDLYEGLLLRIRTDIGTSGAGLTRKVVKGIVLAQLYGASKETIKAGLPLEVQGYADLLIQNIKDVFLVDHITKALRTEWQGYPSNHRWITNYFGRRVATSQSHTLFNHYVQSTAVDIAMLGFNSLLSYIDMMPLSSDKIVPLFILHDALILDVHPNALSMLTGLAKVASTGFPGLPEQVTFPLSVDREFNKPTHQGQPL